MKSFGRPSRNLPLPSRTLRLAVRAWGCPCCRNKNGPEPSDDDAQPDRRATSPIGTSTSRRSALLGASLLPGASGSAARADPTQRGLRLPFYDEFMASAMQNGMVEYEATMAPLKQKLFKSIPPGARTLEIGIGTAPNLAYYPKGIQLVGLDPNPRMLDYARRNAEARGREIRTVEGSALALPFGDGSMDVVVGTLLLCSVPSQLTVLTEVRRVLRRGGKFIFIEHVVDPERGPRRALQFVLNPLEQLLADGCNLNRDTLAAIRGSGLFAKVDATETEIEGMFLIAPHVIGVATA